MPASPQTGVPESAGQRSAAMTYLAGGRACDSRPYAFRPTFKRDYVRINALPDAVTALGKIAGWFEDYNENHPHSGLKMRSPREFIRAQTQ